MVSYKDDGVNPVRRIVRADPYRKTRFHDQKGNLVDPIGACYAPRAFAEAVLRRTVGYRPCLPWLSYRAIRAIAGIVGKDATVLEYGSGISTIWFAERCRFIYSIDDDPDWHDRVRALLEARRLRNIRLELRSLDENCEPSDCADATFDFALVDGGNGELREDCVKAALRKLRSGGAIYLDNTDMSVVRGAEQVLLREVKARGGRVRYFVDFCPATLTVQQGLLATV